MKEIIALLIFIVIATITIFLAIEKKIEVPIIATLLIFAMVSALAAANYDVIRKFKWKDFELETIKNDIKDLKIKIEQTLVLKQQISTTVNNVTEVKKEIANLKEVIHQHYAAFKTEKFEKRDLGNRIAVYANPLDPKGSVILFQLQVVPEENSVQIADRIGTYAPPTSYSMTSNVIGVNRGSILPNNILIDDKDYYVVKYIPDAISDKKMVTIKDVKITVKDGEVNIFCPYETKM